MSTYYEVKLYGGDYIACNSASETAESLLASYDNCTIDILAINPYHTDESESQESPGGFVSKTKKQRATFKLRVVPFIFPTDYDDYADLMEVLNNNYIWLKVVTYPLIIHTVNYCIMCEVTSYSSEEEEGTITVEIELRKALPNV